MGDQSVQRRLAAIMAADVAGYSRPMGIDEEGTLVRLKAIQRDVIYPLIALHRGEMVKTTGDGFLATFGSVVDAVRCAVRIQNDILRQPSEELSRQGIAFRIGINLGDVIPDDGDVFGDGVNVAARLQETADPGGIAVSSAAHENAAVRAAAAFEDSGEHSLKNIDRPIRIWKWHPKSLTATVKAIERSEALPLPEKPSIAVLPFHNMSGDAEQEHFADGVTEDVITALSRSPWLFVIARNSTFAYKGKSIDIKRVAQELGVAYVLEGSVRKAGDRVRVTAQLIEGSSGAHVWAEKYDGRLDVIFDLQDDITRKVVASLHTQIQLHEGSRAEQAPRRDLATWDLVSRAWKLMYSLEKDSLKEGRRLSEQAVRLAPDSSEAHHVLSACLAHLAHMGFAEDRERALLDALAAAKRAVELDQRNEYAHWICGAAHLFLRNHDFARAELERAVELNPNCSLAYGTLATVLAYMGESELSIENNELAIRTNPRDPSIFFRFGGIAIAHFTAQHYEAAVEWSRKTVLRKPSWFVGHAVLTAALANLEREDEARGAATEYLRNLPNATVHNVAQLPFRNPAHADCLIQGLRRAGVPE